MINSVHLLLIAGASLPRPVGTTFDVLYSLPTDESASGLAITAPQPEQAMPTMPNQIRLNRRGELAIQLCSGVGSDREVKVYSADGRMLGRIPSSPTQPISSFALADDGTVYVATQGNRLFATTLAGRVLFDRVPVPPLEKWDSLRIVAAPAKGGVVIRNDPDRFYVDPRGEVRKLSAGPFISSNGVVSGHFDPRGGGVRPMANSGPLALDVPEEPRGLHPRNAKHDITGCSISDAGQVIRFSDAKLKSEYKTGNGYRLIYERIATFFSNGQATAQVRFGGHSALAMAPNGDLYAVLYERAKAHVVRFRLSQPSSGFTTIRLVAYREHDGNRYLLAQSLAEAAGFTSVWDARAKTLTFSRKGLAPTRVTAGENAVRTFDGSVWIPRAVAQRIVPSLQWDAKGLIPYIRKHSAQR